MADRLEMFAPTRGFSGMANSMEPCKMLWAYPVAMATTFGLITYGLVIFVTAVAVIVFQADDTD